jgi:hypothetical protein
LSALAGLGFGFLTWLAPTVVVEWETASELETVGFNIYRSENPYEGYEKVNKIIIPSHGDSLGGGKYSFSDSQVRAFRRYYYTLEDVNAEGTGNRYGPIQVDWVGWIELSLAAILLVVGGIGLAVLAAQERVMRVRAGNEGQKVSSVVRFGSRDF